MNKREVAAIGLHEVGLFARGELPRAAVTTAHLKGYQFFRKRYAKAAPASMLERLSRACSPFALDGLLKDAKAMRPDTRTARRWALAARVRRAELRGEVLGS